MITGNPSKYIAPPSPAQTDNLIHEHYDPVLNNTLTFEGGATPAEVAAIVGNIRQDAQKQARMGAVGQMISGAGEAVGRAASQYGASESILPNVSMAGAHPQTVQAATSNIMADNQNRQRNVFMEKQAHEQSVEREKMMANQIKIADMRLGNQIKIERMKQKAKDAKKNFGLNFHGTTGVLWDKDSGEIVQKFDAPGSVSVTPTGKVVNNVTGETISTGDAAADYQLKLQAEADAAKARAVASGAAASLSTAKIPLEEEKGRRAKAGVPMPSAASGDERTKKLKALDLQITHIKKLTDSLGKNEDQISKASVPVWQRKIADLLREKQAIIDEGKQSKTKTGGVVSNGSGGYVFKK
jgi:hypothetical protein